MNSKVGLLVGVLLVVSLISTRFLGRAPLVFSSSVTPLWNVFYTVSNNLRGFVETLSAERDLRTENRQLTTRLGTLETDNKRLIEESRNSRRSRRSKPTISPGVVAVAQVVGVQFRFSEHLAAN